MTTLLTQSSANILCRNSLYLKNIGGEVRVAGEKGSLIAEKEIINN